MPLFADSSSIDAMMTRLILLLLLCIVFVGVVNGWGAKFDPVHRARGGGGRTISTTLQAMEEQYDDERKNDYQRRHGNRKFDSMTLEDYREKLNKMYRFSSSQFDMIRSDDMHHALRRYHDDFHLDDQDSLAYVEDSDFDEDNILLTSSFYVIGEEEEEEDCQIPEELKLSPGEIDPSDVMNFLGIRRAEPLRKVSDWE